MGLESSQHRPGTPPNADPNRTDKGSSTNDAPHTDRASFPGRDVHRGGIHIRQARTADVSGIIDLAAPLVENRVLVPKERVVYYESIQEFMIAENADGELIGFGALHVMWEDLAEVRTLASAPGWSGRGVGSALLNELLERGLSLGVKHIFCLTFETAFFLRHGFEVMANQAPLDPAIYAELLRSPDEGVAEFLDLARVKPNTLGNTRMILDLMKRNHEAKGAVAGQIVDLNRRH